ncbi:MAG: ThiF family adenylyltransferase [Campylobacteraceae bacterium]
MQKRFLRNKALISDMEQQLLSQKKVLVVGLGGLGSHAIEGLVRLGIQHFGICDNDTTEETNLNRQLLVTEETLGQNKQNLAKKRIEEINKHANITVYEENFPSSKLLSEFAKYDIVMDCLDNIQTRQILEDECIKENIPLIYGAIGGYYSYFGVSTKENRLIKYQISNLLGVEKKLGNPYFTVSITAGFQVLLAINVMLKKEYLKKGFYALDLKDFTIDEIVID